MKNSFIYLILGIALLSGCGKSHPYKKQKLSSYIGPVRVGSGGYSDYPRKENRAGIEYCDAAGHHQAMHLCMIRAAEITIETGNRYFSIDSFNTTLADPYNYTSTTSRKKTEEEHSHLISVLEKKYKPKDYGDSSFLIKDWYSLSWDTARESHYPPIVSMGIGLHKEDPGYFVYDAEKVYRDLMPRYEKKGINKSITDLRRINYTVYQLDEETALVATVANRKDLFGMTVELNVLVAAEYALSKGFQTIKLITSSTDHFKLTEYYSDFEKKDIKDYDEVFNLQKAYISYLVIKMSKEKGDDLLDCSKLKSHITARSKEIVGRELERIKKEKEAERNAHMRTPKRN